MGVARWQRILLSGGLLEPGEGRRTVRDWVVDLAIFAVALASGVYVLSSTWDQHSPAIAALDIALGLVACGALWWRRERPGTVAAIAIPLSAVSGLAAMAPLPALFNAAIRLPLRQVALWTGLAVVLSPVFPLLYPDVEGRGYGWQVIVGLLLTAVALGWGLFVRAQRELVRGLRERAEDEAREAERRRIAREMHDVLAHRLSILSVHAGALENRAAAAGVPRGRARDPDERARGAGGAAAGDRAAAARGVRRRRAATADAGGARGAGRGVALGGARGHVRRRVPAGVPELVGRTAYRTVQEGLTNARKHAGEERGRVDDRRRAAAGGRARQPRVGRRARCRARAPGWSGSPSGSSSPAGRCTSARRADGSFVLRATLPW